jgi:integrase
MIFIAMLLGLRCSEILGLRWEDFDIKRRADTVEIFTGGARRLLPGKRRPLCHPERWNRKIVSWPLWNRVKMSGLPKTRVSKVAWGARP